MLGIAHPQRWRILPKSSEFFQVYFAATIYIDNPEEQFCFNGGQPYSDACHSTYRAYEHACMSRLERRKRPVSSTTKRSNPQHKFARAEKLSKRLHATEQRRYSRKRPIASSFLLKSPSPLVSSRLNLTNHTRISRVAVWRRQRLCTFISKDNPRPNQRH